MSSRPGCATRPATTSTAALALAVSKGQGCLGGVGAARAAAQRILVKFPSPRMRSIASSMIAVDRPMCSYDQDAGKGGTFAVTAEQLAALKACRADRKLRYRAFRFSVVRSPDDFFPCHR
jgi:hypothetical protein